MKSQFIQIHALTSYPAALLNRDDAGFAKRVPFGGRTRTRISSQCLKRHWRTFEGDRSLSEIEIPRSIRSRVTFQRRVIDPLVGEGHDGDIVRAATEAVLAEILGESAKAKKAKESKSKDQDKEDNEQRDELATGQITVLGEPEVEFVKDLVLSITTDAGGDPKKVKEALKAHLTSEQKKNLKAMKKGAGLDAAMFGRMVTSDILARCDAAVHVAHAFTVHDEEAEADYFSAVDDLKKNDDEGSLGSGHIGTTELTSGLFYSYVVIDVPLLVSNLTGAPRSDWTQEDLGIARKVTEQMVHLIATVSPGAKLGSTAPYSYASLVMVETGSKQPRTLANAFLKPVNERPDLLENTYQAMGRHLAELDRVYGQVWERQLVGLGNVEAVADAVRARASENLDSLASWTAAQIGARNG